MSLFLQFEGASPWPDFRCLQLLHSCQQASDNLATLEITTLYVVALNSELAATQQQRLADLLNAKPATGSDDEDIWLVAPRLGTGSPWGDKATQMLHHCGFEEAHRIEAVKRFHLGWHHRPKAAAKADIAVLLHDPMTESVLRGDFNPQQLFASTQAPEQHHIPLLEEGAAAIASASYDLQLNLAPDDQKMLVETFTRRLRNPTEVELMTFAQINSEHCRHRTFRTAWRNQGEPMPASLFDLIRSTWSAVDGAGVLVAYSDNAAVLEGVSIDRFGIHPNQQCYRYQQEQVPILIKVETHNHPTAISPFSGAATGAGGEIRDEGAVGRGSKPKAGLTGFTLSHLHLPDNAAPWELDANHPPNVATPLQIILEAPIGSAAYNNEFGRPNLLGYFRTFEQHLLRGTTDLDRVRGYHKPVMLAGGLGSVRPGHVKSLPAQPGNLLIVLGGPAMLIGMGGSTASSQVAGSGDVAYDFASVQRANPEMQRRCQEVIDSCTVLGEENPIQRIHDVGAGGLSNAMPELVNDGGTGARIDLDAVPVAQAGLSPAQIWCNESQERYVLRVALDKLWDFTHICRRERCPFAVLGETTAGNQLEVTVGAGQNQSTCLDLPLTTLFGDVILPERNYQPIALAPTPLPSKTPPLADIARQVLAFPAVAAKMFLITIGDRSITGLIARDQLVGPWQLPVADVAVTLRGYRTLAGEAMAIGERPQLALLNPAAAARMTLAESLTNLASADVSRLSDVKVSANWMAAVDHPGEAARLRDAVVALSECCIDLGVCVPVGKDSLSMQINWEDKNDTAHQVTSPVTLNVTAFAPITNAALTLTPELKPNQDSHLVFIDLADGKCRLGGSVYAQVQQALGGVVDCPDLEEQTKLGAFFALLDSYRSRLLAYHDRSDGGLLVTLAEMAFAGHSGLRIELPPDVDPVAWLFNEELGAVVQVANADLADFRRQADNLKVRIQPIGRPDPSRSFVFTQDQQDILKADFGNWLECWWSLSHQIQKLRDHPDCADAELAAVLDETPGLSAKLGFDPVASISQHRHGRRAKVAILREQGVNGQLEMAAAFYEAGFDPIDVHMSDLAAGRTKLDDHQLLALCGGFSYGDVLGAGVGWARSILYNPELRAMFGDWFERPDRLTLGVCNGCQMLSELRDIIPGTEHWPRFLRNRSEQFEARLSLVRVADNTSSAFLDGMGGSILPVAVAHGEGQAVFTAKIDAESLPTELIALQYTDHDHNITEAYPYNPNGSVQGIAGLTTPSGRLIAMMPHPERVFRTIQHSWHPPSWGPTAPWLRLFRNARIWLNQA